MAGLSVWKFAWTSSRLASGLAYSGGCSGRAHSPRLLVLLVAFARRSPLILKREKAGVRPTVSKPSSRSMTMACSRGADNLAWPSPAGRHVRVILAKAQFRVGPMAESGFHFSKGALGQG